eukprot:CAMPEP_0171428488 /NCGR_PEP_ID=MMETSP0881-20121228/5280_1 /TAXON_ID=67004 /ORGANISM="Thalassiosira weissflogii, Strain CCMP1336" /LENGTH=63 /DNA_ID=CAMNT_0011948287 /DNA_START=30 /DNA_END=218 /DNA_ORIENTATION=+
MTNSHNSNANSSKPATIFSSCVRSGFGGGDSFTFNTENVLLLTRTFAVVIDIGVGVNRKISFS